MSQRKPPAKAAVPKHPKEDASRKGQGSVDPKEAGRVRFFLVIVEVVVTVHVLLGARSNHPVSTRGREGPHNSARNFL